jgi:hypothetical protein
MDPIGEQPSVLKRDLAELKTSLADIRANCATKADLARLEVTMVKMWIVGVVTLSAVIVFAVKFVH